jgi:hypothetical protein
MLANARARTCRKQLERFRAFSYFALSGLGTHWNIIQGASDEGAPPLDNIPRLWRWEQY